MSCLSKHRGKAIGGHREKVTICKTMRETSDEMNSVNILNLDFQPPEW